MIEALAGLILNVIVADSTTGQNLMKGVITYNKIENMKQDDKWKASLHEESHQILKDAIREAGKQ
jgi:hypothetical protein